MRKYPPGGQRAALRVLRLAALPVLVALAGAPARAGPAGPGVDFVADLVAKTFLRALFDGNAAELAPLVAERLSFDGETLDGAAARRRLGEVAGRARAHGRPHRIVVLTYAEARARFGEAPARLKPIRLAGTVVALARLEHGGLIAILKRVGGRWKVVGLSD